MPEIRESEAATRMSESNKAIGVLAENKEVFVRAAYAFDRKDARAFQGALRQANLLPRCRVITYWFCRVRCVLVCGWVCRSIPIPWPPLIDPERLPGPIPDPVPERILTRYKDLHAFARVAARVDADKGMMQRLQKAADSDDLKVYRTLMTRLTQPVPKLYRPLLCQLVCARFCYGICQRRFKIYCTW